MYDCISKGKIGKNIVIVYRMWIVAKLQNELKFYKMKVQAGIHAIIVQIAGIKSFSYHLCRAFLNDVRPK